MFRTITFTLIAIFAISINAAANSGSIYPSPVVDDTAAYASIEAIEALEALENASEFLPDLLSASTEAVDYFDIKAEFDPAYLDPCSSYYGRGYCTDFIQRKTGRRQSGNAGRWAGNIPVREGRGGDVAIFTYPAPFGHVAYITRPVYAYNTANLIAYDIEEWNYGPTWVNRPCGVTNKFGITTTRRVPVSAVSRIWRP